VTGFPLDGPVPAPPPDASSQTFSRVLYETARRENMTLRDLYNLTAAARGHWVLCGTPKRIADTLEEWFVEEAADGFNVLPPYFPGALVDFVDLVVPELQARGLFRREYEGTTLRDHFGLPRVPAPADTSERSTR
jgi:alkanesulfonate monooxygenase SsuD/methylene tetrahydromethanopterin reductase-like flavin-dependent oxidoreductase (luciferase family)